MTVKNNQLSFPFEPADKSKLDGIEAGATAVEFASQAEALAGTDNIKAMTSLRVAEAIAAATSGPTSDDAVIGTFVNGAGATLDALTPVCQNSSGLLEIIDPSIESDVDNILGVLLVSTINGAAGTVAIAGLVKNVTTAFEVGDTLYVAKDGTLSTTIPDIGMASFLANDFVIKIGEISQNSANPSGKDLIVAVEVIGSL